MPNKPERGRRAAQLKAARGMAFDDSALQEMISKAEGILNTLLGDFVLDECRIKNANDAYKILNAATGLVRAKIELSRWHAERSGLLREARAVLLEEIRLVISDKPDLVRELTLVHEESLARLEERALLPQ